MHSDRIAVVDRHIIVQQGRHNDLVVFGGAHKCLNEAPFG